MNGGKTDLADGIGGLDESQVDVPDVPLQPRFRDIVGSGHLHVLRRTPHLGRCNLYPGQPIGGQTKHEYVGSDMEHARRRQNELENHVYGYTVRCVV